MLITAYILSIQQDPSFTLDNTALSLAEPT